MEHGEEVDFPGEILFKEFNLSLPIAVFCKFILLNYCITFLLVTCYSLKFRPALRLPFLQSFFFFLFKFYHLGVVQPSCCWESISLLSLTKKTIIIPSPLVM